MMMKIYKRSGAGSGIATQKNIQGTDNLYFDMHKLVKMPCFTNEFHDILDLVIYGRSIKAIKYAIEDKWNDAQRESKYIKSNTVIGTIVNKVATWTSGIVRLGFPQLFP